MERVRRINPKVPQLCLDNPRGRNSGRADYCWLGVPALTTLIAVTYLMAGYTLTEV
jgi:hypothetical protein